MSDKFKFNILHVEDEPTLQFVFEKQLAKLGYKVTSVAPDGLSAVEKALAVPFDLIFMDIQMPKMDGITATEKIRAQEPVLGSRCRIIGLTAFAEKSRCLEAGMDDFLQKPVMLEQLSETLQKWLHDTKLHAQSAGIPPKETVHSDHKQHEEKISDLRDRFGI